MNAQAKMRWFAGAATGALLVATLGAGTAMAADGDSSGIDVSVNIEDKGPAGELTMTVASNEGVVLAENGSTDEVRQFTGTTPTVTVSDTRDPADIPTGAYWAVVGQASDFAGAADPTATIGAEYLGWTPKLLTPSTTGLVAEGEPVDGAADQGPGLVGQELLASTFDSTAEQGSWDVAADLALRTPADVAPGEYHSTITLTLMEQTA